MSFVNYNSTEFLIRCLESINKHSNGLTVEILVADNASVDFDPKQIYRIFPKAIITTNEDNKGFAYAQNQNFALSKAEIFLLLNPDTIVTGGVFQSILATFKRFHAVAIVGANLLSPDGGNLASVKHFPTVRSALFELLFFDMIIPKSNLSDLIPATVDFQYVQCITGAAFAVRSHVYRSLGGLDSRFFMYFEEVDFCKRITETLHQEIVLLPHVKVIHYHGRSSIQTDARQTAYYESYYLYFKKHYGLLTSFLIRDFIILNTIARILGIQIKYFPFAKGWKKYSLKMRSTLRLLLWAVGLRQSSRDFS